MLKHSILLLSYLIYFSYSEPCSPRQVQHGFVCVCNSTYCDTVPPLGELSNNNLKIYYTAANNPGFNVLEATFGSERNPDLFGIKINPDETHQKIIGFGGAFTDAAGININQLTKEAQQKLLESYFADDGIEYNICRVPLGSCDFSPRPYTLDDHDNDWTLEHFALQPEDLNDKIPIIKKAQEIRGDKPLNLFASSWTAPRWMKDKYAWNRGTQLLRQNFQLFANYTLKFFDEYLKHGVKFWGMTTANEPLTGYYKNNDIPNMGWSIMDQLLWLTDYLGPTIRNSQHKDLKIMIHDDNSITLPLVAPVFIEDEKALAMMDGIAVHWYWNGPDMMYDLFKTDKKDIFILASEACHFGTEPQLGNWGFAAQYLDNIYLDLNLGYAGWVEWNLALNITGGPTHINTPADSPIIISEDFTEFYKEPMFYAIGQFSKFVLPGSVRVGVTATRVKNQDMRILGFVRPDNLKVLTIYNYNSYEVDIQIEENNRFSNSIKIAASSLTTIIYK